MSCGEYRKIRPKELHPCGGKSPQKSQPQLPDTCWLLCVHGFAQKTSATSFPLDENWPGSLPISGRSQYNDSVVKFLTSDETLSKSGFLFWLLCLMNVPSNLWSQKANDSWVYVDQEHPDGTYPRSLWCCFPLLGRHLQQKLSESCPSSWFNQPTGPLRCVSVRTILIESYSRKNTACIYTMGLADTSELEFFFPKRQLFLFSCNLRSYFWQVSLYPKVAVPQKWSRELIHLFANTTVGFIMTWKYVQVLGQATYCINPWQISLLPNKLKLLQHIHY